MDQKAAGETQGFVSGQVRSALDGLEADAYPLAHVEHFYSNTSVYWMTWEDFDTEAVSGTQTLIDPHLHGHSFVA